MSGGEPATDERAALIGLHACLPLLTSVQASRIHERGALRTLADLRAGSVPADVARLRAPGLAAAWDAAARSCDPVAVVAAHAAAGVWIADPSEADWPLADDPAAPPLLFGLGRRDLLGRAPAVAIVGTRRCTAIGRRVAAELGRDLALAGIDVVSGLALGIDGAAHRGAVDAADRGEMSPRAGEPSPTGAPIAVVAGGVDIVYPRRHAALFADVGRDGLILSESALGVGVEPWRFLARNRLIAALADLVIVVESNGSGGALATASEALERGIEVGAVPGSVLSAASVGTNALLADGASVIRSVDDVLELLSLGTRRPTAAGHGAAAGAARPGAARRGAPDPPSDLDPLERRCLAEARAGVDGLEALAVAVGRPVAEVLSAVTRLQLAGELELMGGRVTPVATSPTVGPAGSDARATRKAPLR